MIKNVKILLFLLVFVMSLPAYSKEQSASILINASPQKVWDVIHVDRNHNFAIEYSKILKEPTPEEPYYLIEQKHILLPTIRAAICIYKSYEYPCSRINYILVESDHFKKMDGQWLLEQKGNKTLLTLTCDTKLKSFLAPQWLVDQITKHRTKERVKQIKVKSEL